MLSGTRHERRVYTGRIITKRTVIGGFANTLGRSFSYFFIYIATTAYTLLLIPHIFKLVQLADSSTLIPFLSPYLLSVTFFSMLISRFVKERESIILLMVFYFYAILIAIWNIMAYKCTTRFLESHFMVYPLNIWYQWLCKDKFFRSKSQ